MNCCSDSSLPNKEPVKKGFVARILESLVKWADNGCFDPSKEITRVWLDESENDCTMCGACEVTCPEVFKVPEKMVVVQGADYKKNAEAIRDAAEGCCVAVIAIEYNHSGKRDNPP